MEWEVKKSEPQNIKLKETGGLIEPLENFQSRASAGKKGEDSGA